MKYSMERDMFEKTGLILAPGKEGVRNSGQFEIAEFEIADSKRLKT